MARLSYPEQVTDKVDRMLAAMGNLDARLRVAERRAKLRELERLEDLEQRARAQASLPMMLPEQVRPGARPANPPQNRKKGGPAATTLHIFGAMAAYIDSGELLDENWRPGELGRRVAAFAKDHDLEGADEISLVADEHTTRDLMEAVLKAIRRINGR